MDLHGVKMDEHGNMYFMHPIVVRAAVSGGQSGLDFDKKQRAYYADDLGAPGGRNDVARTHEEYERHYAGYCFPSVGYVENGYSQGVVYGELETFFPAWQARANVPADKDKRVRLSYLMDFFAAELAEPDECWNKEHWDSLRPLEEEMEVLRKEVSPWGGDTRYEWDGKLSG